MILNYYITLYLVFLFAEIYTCVCLSHHRFSLVAILFFSFLIHLYLYSLLYLYVSYMQISLIFLFNGLCCLLMIYFFAALWMFEQSICSFWVLILLSELCVSSSCIGVLPNEVNLEMLEKSCARPMQMQTLPLFSCFHYKKREASANEKPEQWEPIWGTW